MNRTFSPQEIAAAIDASESSIKRWIDGGRIEALKTQGGHRRVTLESAIQFVRESGRRIVQPGALGFHDADSLTEDEMELGGADLLYELLLAGEERRARGLILSIYLRGESLAALCDGPIRRAMERIGEYAQRRIENVRIEHQATDICMQALNQLRVTIPFIDEGPLAIGGAIPGDPYFLPSLCVSLVLQSEGFHPINLGPNTPYQSIRNGIDDRNPMLVWISISSDRVTRDIIEGASELAEYAHKRGCAAVAGGRNMERICKYASNRLICLSTLTEFTAFLRGLRTTEE
ncbi:MAG: hypothetical protein GC154_05930 [bacterium]|nr:hypothetical protein [bacterium]